MNPHSMKRGGKARRKAIQSTLRANCCRDASDIGMPLAIAVVSVEE